MKQFLVDTYRLQLTIFGVLRLFMANFGYFFIALYHFDEWFNVAYNLLEMVVCG